MDRLTWMLERDKLADCWCMESRPVHHDVDVWGSFEGKQ